MGQPLPSKYAWLEKEPGPKVLIEALKHYGTLEHPGVGSNPNILAWANETGVSGWYTDDDIPWCGLFAGVVVKRCGYEPPKDFLAAKNFLNFGTVITIGEAKLFDLLIYKRPGGYHVAFYVGENKNAFLNYGGNQSNAVGFAGIDKSRCIGVRRCPWKIAQPPNVRKIWLADDFGLSTNEA